MCYASQLIGSKGDNLHSLEAWIRYGDEVRRPLCVAEDFHESSAICIVGAGLSGLTLAYRIASKRPDIQIEIIEKSNRCGGVIETWSHNGWICDVAVNATRPHPAFWRLVRDLNLGTQFSPSNAVANSRWVSTNGRSRKLSPWFMLGRNPIRIWRGVKNARKGGRSVADSIPLTPINDAMTLGIVNDYSANVDADFLMPSMTQFGEKPPRKWSKIKKQMQSTYPLFTPKRGSTASFAGGMQTLVDGLVETLNDFENVTFSLNVSVDSPEEVAKMRNLPLSSVAWCGPLSRNQGKYTELNIYAVGYTIEQVSAVKVGYGTLIPDANCPVSGILHESDVHASPRAPEGHRLFRIMSPNIRHKDDEAVKDSLRDLLCKSEPVLFEKIGIRRIPSYPPGYMSSLHDNNPKYTKAGWYYSGISVTHVVTEAERIADLF